MAVTMKCICFIRANSSSLRGETPEDHDCPPFCRLCLSPPLFAANCRHLSNNAKKPAGEDCQGGGSGFLDSWSSVGWRKDGETG